MSDRIKILALSAVLNITPLAAFAQISDPCRLIDQLFNVVKLFGNVILVVAIFMILYSGFLFLTGGGNEETLKKAKTILIYALIGLAVAFLATSAKPLIQNLIPGWELPTKC